MLPTNYAEKSVEVGTGQSILTKIHITQLQFKLFYRL